MRHRCCPQPRAAFWVGLFSCAFALARSPARSSPPPATPGDKRAVDPHADARALYEAGRHHLYTTEDYTRALRELQAARARARTLGDRALTADVLSDISACYFFSGHPRETLIASQECLALREALGDRARIAEILQGRSVSYTCMGQFTQALECVKRCRALREELGDGAGVARALIWTGVVYGYCRHDYPRALEYFQQGAARAEASMDLADTIGAYLRCSGVYHEQHRDALAVREIEGALRLAEARGNIPLARDALTEMGILHREQRRYADALECFEKGVAMLDRAGDKNGECDLLTEIGLTREAAGQPDLALSAYEKSLTLRPAGERQRKVAWTLSRIGVVHQSQGRLDAAWEYYQKSLTLARAIGCDIDLNLMGEPFRRLGVRYQDQGNYQLALQLLRQALSLDRAGGRQRDEAYAVRDIGGVYAAEGNDALALDYFHRSAKLFAAVGESGLQADVLRHIGGLYLAEERLDAALEAFREGVRVAETMGDKGRIGAALYDIGEVYEHQGDNRRALAQYQKCLALDEEGKDPGDIAATRFSIGEFYARRRDYARARAIYQQCLAFWETIPEKPRMARAHLALGKAYEAEGSYALARERYRSGAAVAEASLRYDYLLPCEAGLARVLRAEGRSDEAIAAYRQLIDRIEAVRSQVAGGDQDRERFFEGQVAPYQALVELLLARGMSDEAFAYAERARARALLDVLDRGRVPITRALSPAEQQREQQLTSAVAAVNSQLFREKQQPHPDAARLADLDSRRQKARYEYEAFETEVYAAHPELVTYRGGAKPITREEAGALLPTPQSALLEFVVTERKTFLFVLSHEAQASSTRSAATQHTVPSLHVYTLPIAGAELRTRVSHFRARLAQRDEAFAPEARELYQLLLAPARAQLKGKKSWVVVPDGPLWELPFQALQSAPGRYVLEECAVACVPSLTVLREMRRFPSGAPGSHVAPRPRTVLMALANPALGKQTVEWVRRAHRDADLHPLPEAEKEVKALAHLYGPARSKVYIGPEAREERVKAEAGAARILHFATHGILDDQSPMYSCLVLSQVGRSRGEDGLLEAWELMNLNLHADLVVLSACETARGRVSAGEGMIGMTWALFVAGCPTTVATLWKVESRATEALMLPFHRAFRRRVEGLRSAVSKGEALREAQLKLLGSREYRHPFYWAGFAMFGDAQ